jgi:transcriptional regulator with XRE-family HTH domain
VVAGSGRLRHTGNKSDNVGDDKSLAVAIGAQLKGLRSDAKLSLEQLSKRSRVSRGMLSQIELGRSVPTITVLSRIAAAFDLPPAVFLTAEKSGRGEVLKRNDADVLTSPDGKFVSRALFPFGRARRVEFYELTLSPGCHYISDAHQAGTTENMVVASGTVEVEAAGEKHLIKSGDSVHFIADQIHAYSNRDDSIAVAYLVMAYTQPVTY